MLLSMTGFGNAAQSSETAHVSVELKAVNNRYLKVSMRLPEIAAKFESEIEKLIRDQIARGSVQMSFRIRLDGVQEVRKINSSVLNSYMQQLKAVHEQLNLGAQPLPALTDLLQLPGVIEDSEVGVDVADSIWPLLKSVVEEAMTHFHEFRGIEGESMRHDLKLQCRVIEEQVNEVEKQAPQVVAEYRAKLLDRVRKAVSEADVQIDDKDVIREVATFADRCDINEEITRLRSHIQQFYAFTDSDKSQGRKLEFIGQEMFREINTIGSKANNVPIAHAVVEMKAAIERIREVLQNVE